MRTTIRLDESLLAEVKKYAAKHQKTLTAIIEDALRETLARQKAFRRAAPVKLTTFKGSGTHPGIDLDDSASLLDAMDDANVSS